MIDIEKREELIAYLESRGIVSKEDGYTVDYCKGGVSSITALIEIPGKTMLIKQGRERFAVAIEWIADRQRIAMEAKANAFYNKYLPDMAPAVISYDAENYIMLREAAPAGCRMWKEDILDGILDFKIARKTIEALVTIHNESAGKADVKEDFSEYKTFYQLRISPYLEFLATRHPQLAPVIQDMIKKLDETHVAVVHADYSPKNILVLPDRNICILDYEIAHYGDPAFDLAFYINHIVLKSVFLPHMSAAILNMMLYMTDTYLKMERFEEKAQFEERCVKMLAVFMLTRIDGKSPVEYITDETQKELVRKMAYRLMESGAKTFAEAAGLFLEMERAYQQDSRRAEVVNA